VSDVWTDTTAFPLATEVADDDQLPMADMSAAAGSRQRNLPGSVARAQLGGAASFATDPGVGDDTADGYRAGSLWLNTTDGGLFVCTDATAGAAVWEEFGVGLSAGDDAANLGSGAATDGQVFTADGAGGAAWETTPKQPVPIIVAVSDETTDLTTGTAKVTFRMPFAGTLDSVKISTTTAPTGSVLTVDLNESGTSVLSTKLTIDAGEKTSATAATPAVISDAALADDAEMTVDIDGAGSTVAGAGLKLTMMVTPT